MQNMKIAQMPDGKPEIYLAVQGEGSTIGIPMVFVRLSLCNLHCKWCDTFYTWNFDNTSFAHNFAGKVTPKDYIVTMTEQEVADYITQASKGIKRAIFTGGEPLVQQLFIPKVMELLGNDWTFDLETNGTIIIKPELAEKLTQVNCSPKLANSGNELNLRKRVEAINCLKDYYYKGVFNLCFKFVVSMETINDDLEEIKNWQGDHGVPNELVWLMPLGTKREEIRAGTEFLNKLAEEVNYKVSTRLQILTYGDKRAI